MSHIFDIITVNSGIIFHNTHTAFVIFDIPAQTYKYSCKIVRKFSQYAHSSFINFDTNFFQMNCLSNPYCNRYATKFVRHTNTFSSTYKHSMRILHTIQNQSKSAPVWILDGVVGTAIKEPYDGIVQVPPRRIQTNAV